jgi:hypothetical protein
MPPDTTKWDIESLKKTALAFPDAVAACPERINAIITKYTALRSFHEQNQRGFPLSYENAGFHAHELLDSYSDYKVISSSLRTLMTDVHRNGSKLVEQNKRPELAELADKIQKAFDARKSAMAIKRQIISMSTLNNSSSVSVGASGNVDNYRYTPSAIFRASKRSASYWRCIVLRMHFAANLAVHPAGTHLISV